jgi:apolipoprotein N-acyltransferase
VALATLGGLVIAMTVPPWSVSVASLAGMVLFAAAYGSAPDRLRLIGPFRRNRRAGSPSASASPRRADGAVLTALAFGFAVNLVALRFVPTTVARFTPLSSFAAYGALILLAIAQALPWGVGGWLSDRVSRVGIPRPFAFAFGVYGASLVPAIFPWSAAASLAMHPVAIQTAEFIGERGTTALFALIAALVAEAFRRAATRDIRGAARPFVAAVLASASLLAFGAARIDAIATLRRSAPSLQVALVQPGIAATERWEEERAPAILARLTELTKDAEAQGAALTVWPESAYPFWIPLHATRAPYGEHAILQYGVRGPVLTGVLATGKPGVVYNAATVAMTDGTLAGVVAKRHLLLFGEQVPFEEQLPWLRRIFARGTGLHAGGPLEPLVVGDTHIAVLNCFEDMIPLAGREASRLRPHLVVNVTNDAWFEGTHASALHLRVAVLRAVEMRRDLVRAVNGGATSFVDATGQVRATVRDQTPTVLHANVARIEGPPTFYARAGDAPIVLFIAAACAVAAGARRVRRKREATKRIEGTTVRANAPTP